MRLGRDDLPESERTVILYICAECDYENWIGKGDEFGHFISEIYCSECGHQIGERHSMPGMPKMD